MIKYDELKGKPYDDKAPKSYKLLKLYDPNDLELRLKGVEEKYGREAYAKARKYAEIVFEENNPLIGKIGDASMFLYLSKVILDSQG